MEMYATFWALVPPLIAIVLALITKEVYSSLFVGILVGGLFYSKFSFEGTLVHIFEDGMVSVLTDAYNVGILIFLVVLGTIVCLMNKAGGSAAFGRFAGRKIKTKMGAQLATILLGLMIFVDDYFNCLTVGSVMRPVARRHKISREKLAYLIDATAAPICIIAPISSWAAAVTGCVDAEKFNGFELFLKAIPFNFYAIFTILFMVAAVILKVEFGPMKKKEDAMLAMQEKIEEVQAIETNGKVVDLIIPVITLIACCVVGMLYSGGLFEGKDFITAFSECDASVGLMLGSVCALVLIIIYYLLRRVMNLRTCMDCLPEGFKAMVPAILILVMAWTLKAMTDSLGAKQYVEELVKGSAAGFIGFLPVIVFLVACGLAFATGTSWGTFGILIPIVVSAFENDPSMMIVAISACMAGAVCGDHCSPISDTTIMASAGADCVHVEHVSTQLPYAISVAVLSAILYIIAGFTQNAWLCWAVGIVLLLGALLLLKKKSKKAE